MAAGTAVGPVRRAAATTPGLRHLASARLPPAAKPGLIPTGTCWCECGKQTGIGSFFARGHDKIAEAALTAAEFGGSVPQLLHRHGYGPGGLPLVPWTHRLKGRTRRWQSHAGSSIR